MNSPLSIYFSLDCRHISKSTIIQLVFEVQLYRMHLLTTSSQVNWHIYYYYYYILINKDFHVLSAYVARVYFRILVNECK